ncbi:remorin 4.1 [Cocos nucifera]|uniref:Remorin 4.1 n=1 Tax=Cocos nucifera TaxID=13894 RepID=A0A8K0II48_COCNU|nr:remorin 4.1 [Cocos nucifera]
MDYERIEKPSPPGGGFSPSKLRAMLLGVEKKRKEEEMESKFSLRSEATAADIDDSCGSVSDDCKDVDMVSSLPECSTSLETMSGHRFTDQSLSSSRIRSQEEDSFDSDGVSSAFEFHKGERASHRSALMPPFSKPAPSKWDDAQKWIASPNLNRPYKASGVQPKKTEKFGYGSRQSSTKVVMEITEDADTKRIDPSQEKRGFGGQKAVNSIPNSYQVVDSCAKPGIVVEKVADPAVSLSRHDSSTLPQTATTLITPPSTVRSVSMRDMGTEMTPIASQEPSRTGTPVRASTPTCSPTSSRSTTPQRGARNSNIIANITGSSDGHRDGNNGLSEKELQMKTRREIMILGTQLGKSNIAAWASKEEEEKDASVSLKILPLDRSKSVTEMRAAAWEEAEIAKYQARFKREEIKIQAWENHQKAETEAEMRKIEVEVERMRARAHDKLMNKLAAAKHKAEEMRAAAEARKNQQAARTAQQAEYIRRTGNIPSTFSCWNWCS